jgi:preprotein translocase subunit SecG
MYAFVTILIIIVCVLLGAVVLIQNPKGGGLNASFGGVGQQILGARRSTDIVEKLTWGFAVALIVLCLSTSFFVDKRAVSKKEETPKSEIEKNVANQPFTGGNPGLAPTATPPAGGQQGPQK